MNRMLLCCLVALTISMLNLPIALSDVIVSPYVQNPTRDAMTILWATETDAPGSLTVISPDGQVSHQSTSVPELKLELGYHPTEVAGLPGGKDPGSPYIHRIRVTSLHPGTTYHYTVKQDGEIFSRQFRTAPNVTASVRFVVYADCETEPESTGTAADWAEPFGNSERKYIVDQTEGYRQNIQVIQSRNPDFIAIAGDIVEKGGRQRDWDEFWRHNSGEFSNIASSIPILPAVGNHENYGGIDGYTIEAARRSLRKYQAYFETPDNSTGNAAFEDRFYRVDYGPITLITVDATDGAPDKSQADTNFMLLGENDGGEAPDFNPGSTQYQWLERQLADARKTSRFTFVQFHHSPYSIGPHGFPAGSAGIPNGEDTQSGQPTRVLSPLFEKYGVDAVFCGHDETYEHSVVNGVHYYDIGIGGDGLRGPYSGRDGSTKLPSTNPFQVFLAHLNAPEVWQGNKLISGGKHYGHLEVNVTSDNGTWQVELTPVYVFPVMNETGKVVDWERRIYDDVEVLRD